MPKVYQVFVPPSYWLVRLPIFKALYMKIYSYEEYECLLAQRYIRTKHIEIDIYADQFIGALQPIFDSSRDFLKTFQPYRSRFHILKDLLQPLHGLANMLHGLATITFAVGWFFLYGAYILSKKLYSPHSVKNYFAATVAPFSWLVNGVANIARGAAQIATTPLTWLLRIPLRVALTLKSGYANMMESHGLKRLLHATTQYYASRDPSGETQHALNEKLFSKFTRARQRGVQLPPGYDLEKARYSSSYSFQYAKDYKNGLKILHILPEAIKPYFKFKSYTQLKHEDRKLIFKSVSTIMRSDDVAKEQSIIRAIEEYGLYDLAKLTLLSRNRKESNLHIIPKDVARIIARFSMIHNHEDRRGHNVEAAERTPLLRAKPAI